MVRTTVSLEYFTASASEKQTSRQWKVERVVDKGGGAAAAIRLACCALIPLALTSAGAPRLQV